MTRGLLKAEIHVGGGRLPPPGMLAILGTEPGKK
jgi:hypothetical protein